MNTGNSQQYEMTGRQQLVHRSLSEKSDSVALLYESSLRVLADNANPGRILQASHSIREMTGGLPKVLDLPVLSEQGRMGDRVNALEPIWVGAAKSKCYNQGAWAGEIDGPLGKLLGALHNFFQWWKESRPKRRDVAAGLFRSTDPSGQRLPETLEQKRVQRWLDLHDYFVRVAHGSSTTEDEFRSALDELEQILLENFHRRPSEDFSAIDALLAEDTPNA